MNHKRESNRRWPPTTLTLLSVLSLLIASLLQHAAVSRAAVATDEDQPSLIIRTDDPLVSVVSNGTLYLSAHQVGLFPKALGRLDPAGHKVVFDLPDLRGAVTSLLSDGAGGWYVGGQFTTGGSQPLGNLIHLNANNTLDPAWNPNITQPIQRLALNGTTLYACACVPDLGGPDTVFAVNTVTGKRTGWSYNSGANGRITSIAASGQIVAVGYRNGVGSGGGLFALDASNPAAVLWSVAQVDISALLLNGPTLYVGGSFRTFAGQARNTLAALNLATGQVLPFQPTFEPHYTDPGGGGIPPAAYDATITNMVLDGGKLYVSGMFLKVNGQSRSGVASFDLASGTLTPWIPPKFYLLGVDATAVYGTGLYGELEAVDRSSGELLWEDWQTKAASVMGVGPGGTLLGGDFAFRDEPQRTSGLVAIDARTGVLKPWNPAFTGLAHALAVSGDTLYAADGGISAFDTVTGAKKSWNPQINGSVDQIVVKGQVLYIEGWFSAVSGEKRPGLAALDASTGDLLPWNPQILPKGSSSDFDEQRPMVVGDNALYYVQQDASSNSRVAGLDLTTGAPTGFSVELGPGRYNLALQGTTLYVIGAAVDAYDTTAATAPVRLGSLVDTGWFKSALIKGNTLYVQDQRGVNAFDLSTNQRLGAPFGPRSSLMGSLAADDDALVVNTCTASNGTTCWLSIYGYLSPVVETGAADGLSSSGVTLHGTVDPKETSAAVSFQLTTRRGDCDAIRTLPASTSVLSGTADQTVSLSLADLAPSTTYFYRVVATNRFGASYGSVQQFTTPAGLAAAAPLPEVQTATPRAEPSPAAHRIFLPALRRCPATGEGF